MMQVLLGLEPTGEGEARVFSRFVIRTAEIDDGWSEYR